MINKFHEVSRSELSKSVNKVAIGEASEMQSIAEILDRLMRPAEKKIETSRKAALYLINQRRKLVTASPGNQWHVYELCKQIYELAEIDRVNFNGATYEEKLCLIKLLVPSCEPKVLELGVREYHNSRIQNRWGMHYLQDELLQKHETVEETMQVFQTIIMDFIDSKGLSSELQTFISQYEFNEDHILAEH